MRVSSMIVVVAMLLLGGMPAAAAGTDLPENAPLLFVLRGRARVTGGRLAIATRRVEWFTDRPGRQAGISDAAALVRD